MVAFWDFRAGSRAKQSFDGMQAQVSVDESSLELIELYTEHAMVLARVSPEGRRLSDMLNSNSTLALRDARSISLTNGTRETDGTGWSSVMTEDILFVMPPEHRSPRQMRVHRRQHRVRIHTGPFLVTGTAHILPGTKLDPYVLRARTRFLALTDAYASSMADPAWERSAAVVLVNVRPIADLTEVTTLS